jgi:hypothetical protein
MKNNRTSLKGLWIPIVILADPNLTPNERLLFNASNGYLSKVLNISTRRVQQLLSSLKKKGYISTRNIFHEDVQKVSQRLVKVIAPGLRKNLHVDNIEDSKVFIENNKELNQIFSDFINYRKESGKPLTESSIRASAQKLIELSKNDTQLARKVVDQTIENGWLSLQEVKQVKGQSPKLAKGKILNASGLNDYNNLGF